MNGLVRIMGADRHLQILDTGVSEAVTGPGRLYNVVATNPDAIDYWLAIFDAVAVPANGAWTTALIYLLPVFSGTYGVIPQDASTEFKTGLIAAVSSTGTVLTAATPDYFHARINYVAR